ncbi:MAG TPA: hypothetical protein PKC39_05805 [Ferruginibacter sp.]|nr:hypothetical protein [Ferruginibacter sp.]HMP20456.1 hypothetical protein [Ferruginibacter sp.]
MKKHVLSITLFCLAAAATAQTAPKKQATGNFSDSLFKVVDDFRTNFVQLQRNQLPSMPDAMVYRSATCLPGSLHCVIYRYHSVEDKTASWQAILYNGESFEEAIKAYKNAFNQVKKSRMHNIGGKAAAFEGQMENPDENVRFASCILRLKTEDPLYRNLAAEIELVGCYAGWEVHLNIYTRKRLENKEEED